MEDEYKIEYYTFPEYDDCKQSYTEEEKEEIRLFCERKGIDPRRVIGYDS